jgi:peptidoglycan hydrolase-like protein with peptidoglycan-binding domain
MARIAGCLGKLRAQVQDLVPDAPKEEFGWIGDAAHASRTSDHNPDSNGVVKALDVPHVPTSGLDTYKLADYMIAHPDPRARYIISNRRIAGDAAFVKANPIYKCPGPWQWGPYNGTNPHDMHMHVSSSRDAAIYDKANDWDLGGVIGEAEPSQPPATYPLLKKGSGGDYVKIVQMALMVDGVFGAATEIAVKAFQRRVGITVDGVVGPYTWREIEKVLEPPLSEGGWITNIKATTFGGASERQTSAYDGHVIGANEIGVALPFKFPSPPRVELRNPVNDKTVIAPVVDVGPWLIDDPYWQRGARPEAETRWKANTKLARGPNKGRVPNGAGIDLTPAAMRALGITGGEGYIDFRLV